MGGALLEARERSGRGDDRVIGCLYESVGVAGDRSRAGPTPIPHYGPVNEGVPCVWWIVCARLSNREHPRRSPPLVLTRPGGVSRQPGVQVLRIERTRAAA